MTPSYLCFVQRREPLTHPFSRIEVEVLDVAMLEEAGQADAVVGEMLLLADNYDVVLSSLDVVLDEFFAGGLAVRVNEDVT